MRDSVTATSLYSVLIAESRPLCAHRTAFFNALARESLEGWTFEVVAPASQMLPPQPPPAFSLTQVPDIKVSIRGQSAAWQQFFLKAARYDIVITDPGAPSFTHAAVSVYRVAAKKWVLWGDPREPGAANRMRQLAHKWLVRHASFYFAPTESCRTYMLEQNFPSGRIFLINDTIDVTTERDSFLAMRSRRAALRSQFGVSEQKVIVLSGVTDRIDMVLRVVRLLGEEYHLFILGPCDREQELRGHAAQLNQTNFTFFPQGDRFSAAPVLIAGDVFLHMASVGVEQLAPLCYDLPLVYFDGWQHGPYTEYLSSANSHVLSSRLNAEELAVQLPHVVERLTQQGRDQVFGPIRNLTLEAMAGNFVQAMNSVCDMSRPRINLEHIE